MKRHPFLQKEIPQYGLYGQPAQTEPELIHILDIASRGPGHDWLIQPHRHSSLYQIVYLARGKTEVFVDESNFVSDGGWVLTFPAGTVHGYQFSRSTQGKVITLSEDFVSSIIGRNSLILQQLLEFPNKVRMGAGDYFLRAFKRYLSLLESEIASNMAGKKEMLQSLAGALILTLHRQYLLTKSDTVTGYKARLVHDFQSTLGAHYMQHWAVEQYARALNVSCSTLNRMCHENLGSSAKAVIQNRMLGEIKRRLIYTDESLEKIAWSLGFKDPSYFSRKFKKMTGMTLQEYRKQRISKTYG